MPPLTEAFDTIECAKRAMRAGADPSLAAPAALALALPTIDVLTNQASQPTVAPVALKPVPRSRLPVPAAVAAGLGLVAVGTASSLYLWSGLPGRRQPSSHRGACNQLARYQLAAVSDRQPGGTGIQRLEPRHRQPGTSSRRIGRRCTARVTVAGLDAAPVRRFAGRGALRLIRQ